MACDYELRDSLLEKIEERGSITVYDGNFVAAARGLGIDASHQQIRRALDSLVFNKDPLKRRLGRTRKLDHTVYAHRN